VRCTTLTRCLRPRMRERWPFAARREQGDLAEAVAASERLDDASVADHVGPTGLDDVEALAASPCSNTVCRATKSACSSPAASCSIVASGERFRIGSGPVRMGGARLERATSCLYGARRCCGLLPPVAQSPPEAIARCRHKRDRSTVSLPHRCESELRARGGLLSFVRSSHAPPSQPRGRFASDSDSRASNESTPQHHPRGRRRWRSRQASGEGLDDVALGSLARAYRLDRTETEFSFHTDNRDPLRTGRPAGARAQQ
jgi:hypothetical protein